MDSEMRRVRGHAKTSITNRPKEILHLMRDPENEDLVRQKVLGIKEAFQNFRAVHEAYHDTLADQESKEESTAYFNMVEDQVAQLEENAELWAAGLEARSLIEKLDVRPEDSVSLIGAARPRSLPGSAASQRSSRLNEILDPRIQASANKSILSAESAALRKLQEIEAEELRLKHRRDALKMEVEKIKAEVEEKAFYEAEQQAADSPKMKLEPPPIKFQFPSPDARSDLYNYREPSITNQPKQVDQFQMLFQQQQEAIAALTLPQPDLQVFGGDPIEYHDFTRAFENLIERKTKSSSARLYYLVQYTSGQVRDLVRSCLAMPEAIGYAKARKLLAERYGQSYHIATAYVDKLTSGPTVHNNDGEALQKFSIALTSCSNTLQEIGYLNRLENPDGLRKIMERLPYNLRLKWREAADSITTREGRDASLHDITKFVEKCSRVANHPIFGKVSEPKQPNHYRPSRNVGAKTFVSETQKPPQPPAQTPGPTRKPVKCPSCEKDHWLSQCPDFRKLTVKERYNLVRAKDLCLNCLVPGHFVAKCTKSSFCRIEDCGKKHSTFLHEREQKEHSSKNTEKSKESEQQPKSSTSGAKTQSNGYIRTSSGEAFKATSNLGSMIGLPIVPVQVRAKGQTATVKTYAFLDTGSNTSFCTEDILKRLQVRGKKTALSLTTLQGKDKPIECSLVDLEVLDLDGKTRVELPSVYSRPSLPVSKSAIGQQRDVNNWPYLEGIQVQSIDSEIGLLIGNDCPTALQPSEVRKSQDGGPYATRTVFGWVLNGPLGREDAAIPTANFIDTNEQLNQQFEKYCNLEFNDSAYASNPSLSQNDHRALQIMEDTIELKDGKYEIALPWKRYPPTLENNRIQAESRLSTLKKRLLTDANLCEKYSTFMSDLLEKNHARKVPTEDLSKQKSAFYLVHFPILPTPSKPKVRVVYDCQAKYKGTSLNDQILQGPDLTNSLVGVLTRFRKDSIAFMSDIEKMFYQVRVRPSDCDYLRFLWWPDGNLEAEPVEYQMLVHLFGAVSSPSCANYALKKTAEDNKADYHPSVIKAVNKSFYVDDCLHSVATETEAVKLASDLREILAKGGFRLTKFVSNSKKVLSSLPESERATSVKNLDFDNTNLTERALGVHWNVKEDTFSYKIAPNEKRLNRRGLLSIISSVYDPLGFVSPSILPAKSILQDLCRRGLGWDQEIPEEDQVKWKAWLHDLPKLEQFSIPRSFKPPDDFADIQRYEIHHFADASSTGYGAVSYLRQIDVNGKAHCSLVMAKSRLAPLKAMTIPRMELSAAVLATRLDQMISKEIDLPLAKSTFWTDSTCVIRYIENQDKRFQVFVANRVAAILEQSNPAQWRYVDTEQNPADEASRGMSVDELLQNERWTQGPAFLRQTEDTWPQRPASICDIQPDDPEVKKESSVYTTQSKEEADSISKTFEKFSSWTRLRRVMAWVLRYKSNLRLQVQKRKNNKTLRYNSKIESIISLSVSEVNLAEIEILKHVQKQSFKKELSILNQNTKAKQETSALQSITKSSNIYKLDPTLENGLLLVGGRLQRASIDNAAKHPIIVPKQHHVVRLIIEFYHQLSGHSGVEYTLSLVRQKFWIIGARSSVRSIVGSCFDCRRLQAPVIQQKMANLPEDRVTASRPPFTNVGVDCFGPFLVRRGRVDVKRYGVLFTCLALRAVHIEIANSLDTDSFLNALRRFIARRGPPEEMRSDNGGNFVAGEKELRKSIKEWNQTHINDYLSQRGTKWIFNPPAGSHHGGVWERCIRTVRKVLRAVVKEQRLDDEGLATLMCEVESIVNGRPITKVSDDPRDAEPLTPNHLLLLRAGPAVPPGVFNKQDIYSRSRWRQVQYLADVFWKRWTREYLPSLQQRQKWNKIHCNVSVDDIVLILDDNKPRSSWPLARVLEVHTSGNDGLVRSVKLKTSTGGLVRPVDKIVMLEATNTSTANNDK